MLLPFARGLRSNDADGKKNVKKNNSFNEQKISLPVYHAFCTFLCPFLHDYDVKMSNFAFYGVRERSKNMLEHKQF